ncbi:MAG: diguanylate cyclase [Acidimicrobiales bacterium]
MEKSASDPLLDRLLERHPNAPVAAIGEDGIFVAMPASIPLRHNRVLEARSALDIVVSADRVAVITAWERAKSAGSASIPVRLRSDPDRPVKLRFIDVRPIHGVLVAMFAAGVATEDSLLAPRQPSSVAPRFARARKNELAVLIEVDEATTQILGWDPAEMHGQRSLDFIHLDDQELAIDNWLEMLATPGPGRRVRLRHRHKDGSWVWLEITNHNLLDDPQWNCVSAEMVDISDEMAAHDALRAREHLLHRLTQTIPMGLAQIDQDGNIVFANERLQELVSCEPTVTIEAQFATVIPEDLTSFNDGLYGVLHQGQDLDLEVRLRPPGSVNTRHCALRLRALHNDAGTVTGAILCAEDVTRSVEMRRALEVQATFDPLTGCYNRVSTMSALDALLAGGRSEDFSTAVIFVDLDRFKPVNDEFGHAAGDELLVRAAERLRAVVRGEDLVGRIGGDEFLVVCPRIAGSEAAMQLARRVARVLRQGVELSWGMVDLAASVGVACTQGRSVSADRLVADADLAMYKSKRTASTRPILAESGTDP